MGEYGTHATSGIDDTPVAIETTGWRPTCDCDAPTVPAVVMDPFAGSGRTMEVAKALGRRSLGIELNREYIDTLIVPKCQQQAMFLSGVEVE